MKVKICGLKEKEHIAAAVRADTDYIGFVFAPSKRQISLERARELAKEIPQHIKKVGVFVNPTIEEIEAAVYAVPLDIVQLHGQETMALIEEIKVPVIKAFPIRNGRLPENLSDYHDVIFLLDTPAEEFEGGSGKVFDWEKTNIESLQNERIIIAGGLTAENVQQAIQYFKPYGVDVSSGVESEGHKDKNKIAAFIKAAKGEIK